jgi:hypothetical protein
MEEDEKVQIRIQVALALSKAAQLAAIASDWNLDEVEIDGEMVSTYTLREEFKRVLSLLVRLP